MTIESEWNKEVDEWFTKAKTGVNSIVIPQVGMYPPNPMSDYECVQQHVVASEDLIRHYAYAIGDVNPLWRDREYARNTMYGGIIAPPNFHSFIAAPYSGWPPSTTNASTMPGDTFNVGMTGCEWIYFRDTHAGDEFRCVDRMAEVSEHSKPGSGYRLFLHRAERKYFNQRDELVCIARGGNMRATSPKGKIEAIFAGVQKTRKRRRYTTAELDVVHRAYDDELAGKSRRGAEIRFWEDVTEGEELTPIVAGPLTVYDSAAFFHGMYVCAFGVKYSILKATGEKFAMYDDTGEKMFGCEVHLRDTPGAGTETAMGFGAQQTGIIAHLITNWMGDDGFVKHLHTKCRRPWDFGDIDWAKGKVMKKYIENDEYLVALEVSATNQDGVLQMPGTAVVRLRSREHPTQLSKW